jgi:hypothetical protein
LPFGRGTSTREKLGAATQANSGGHCKPDLDNLNNLNNLIPRTAPFLCCALMTRRGTRRTPAEAATTEQTLSDEATAAPDGHETGGAGDIAPNNRAEEARAARRPGPGRPKAEHSPNTKAAKDRDRWALWVRSSLDSITSTTTYLDSFRVCLPVFLLCALPSHRSASDALTVLGCVLHLVAGGPARQAAARFRDHGRGVAQGYHGSDSASKQSSLTLPSPWWSTLFSPFLSFILPFFSLSLSTASRRKPHIVKFSGDYALRARLPMGSAQPATSVAGPSFAGRSGHNCSTLAATPRRTAALRPPEPPTKPPPPQPPPTELPPTEPPHPRAAKCSRSASQRRTRARATVTRIRMR